MILNSWLLVSMIDGHLFDKLVSGFLCFAAVELINFQEYVARAVRKNSAPFGGIQVRLLSFV